MSLFSAMQSGVSGLFAQSTRMAAISDNISNSGTVGYKRADVDFTTMVTAQSSDNAYSAGGVRPDVYHEIDRKGAIQGTQSSTDMAINGRGFFIVADQSQAPVGQSQSFSLTRAGSFLPDDQGFLRNSAGYYLQGWKLNPDGSLPAVSRSDFSSVQTVSIASLGVKGTATSKIDFGANLPAQAAPGTTLSTDVQYYSPLGAPQSMTLTWTKDNTAPTPVDNRWTLTVSGPQIAGTPTQVVDFNATGPAAGSPATALGPLTVTTTTGQSMTLTIGAQNDFGGVTQFAGDYIPSKINKDGSKAGTVSGVEIDNQGKLYAVFDNGTRQAIYQVPVADVPNPDGLSPEDGNTYSISANSGAVSLWDAGSGPAGQVSGSSLEQSNVDIAEELVSLIETQRAYSSNAKIVQTADEMLQETTQLKR